jgi:hypothetical protein
LVRVKRSDGDTLESAQGIESRDVVNFQRIAQVMAQEREMALNHKKRKAGREGEAGKEF